MSYKDIICPHPQCRRNLTFPATAFRHDVELNLICQFCGGVIFAAALETELRQRPPLIPQNNVSPAWQQPKKECLPIRLSGTPTVQPPARHAADFAE